MNLKKHFRNFPFMDMLAIDFSDKIKPQDAIRLKKNKEYFKFPP